MYPLIFVSLIMWVLIIERLIVFKRLYARGITKKELKEIIKEENKELTLNSSVTDLLIHEIIIKKRNKRLTPHMIDEAVVRVVHLLDKRLEIISVLATMSPLLGLLGTTIGMIKTFFVIAIFGTGNVKALASGISEALITTQTGLFIAIPGIYMSNFLHTRARRLKKKASITGMYLRRLLTNGV
ncbi:hypothetical protein JCM13304A_10620 [Desulfothermus okinawensis JCM 13304]